MKNIKGGSGREGFLWQSSPLSLAPLTFFDLETTGLRPDRGAKITEVAAVSADRRALHWNANSGDPPTGDQLPLLLERLAARVVVGHHVQFDFKFVAYEARRHGLTLPRLQFIDTLGLARAVLGSESDHQLETLLRHFDLLPDAALHQALVDAKATRALFWRLVEAANLQTLADAGAKPLAWTAP